MVSHLNDVAQDDLRAGNQVLYEVLHALRKIERGDAQRCNGVLRLNMEHRLANKDGCGAPEGHLEDVFEESCVSKRVLDYVAAKDLVE